MNTNQNTPALDSKENVPASPQTPERKRRRNGSVARLPKCSRDLANRMLLDGTPYRGIAFALDELGHRVTQRNISTWASGGHQDWLREQERIHEHHSRQDALIDLLRKDEATDLPEVGLQMAATVLSELLTQCPIQLDEKKPDLTKYLQIIRALCRLSRELSNLQEYRDESCRRLGRRHSPEEIKNENEESLDNLRREFSKVGLAVMDAEIAAEDARAEQNDTRAKNGLPPLPHPDEPRPEESLALKLMRQFLEGLESRKKDSSSAQPEGAVDSLVRVQGGSKHPESS